MVTITVGGLDFGREPEGSSPKSRPPITIIAIINLFVVIIIIIILVCIKKQPRLRQGAVGLLAHPRARGLRPRLPEGRTIIIIIIRGNNHKTHNNNNKKKKKKKKNIEDYLLVFLRTALDSFHRESMIISGARGRRPHLPADHCIGFPRMLCYHSFSNIS